MARARSVAEETAEGRYHKLSRLWAPVVLHCWSKDSGRGPVGGRTLERVGAVRPPVQVALARAVAEVPGPAGEWAYEPKYDGWRAVVADGVLHSRRGADLRDRFPEIVAAAAGFGAAVLDGELVALRGGRLQFAALQVGPARRRRDGIAVVLLAFDLLATPAGDDARPWPYQQRRAALDALLDGAPPAVQPVPWTTDRDAALTWLDPAWAAVGVEGVLAKPLRSPYLRDHRSGWRKIRLRSTTEAAVLGVTGSSALVLGLPDRRGRWRAAGVSLPVTVALRGELAALLRPTGQDRVRLPGIVAGLPGGEDTEYLPVHPEVVVEIAVDAAVEYGRWRHHPHVLRLRPDLTALDLATRAQ